MTFGLIHITVKHYSYSWRVLYHVFIWFALWLASIKTVSPTVRPRLTYLIGSHKTPTRREVFIVKWLQWKCLCLSLVTYLSVWMGGGERGFMLTPWHMTLLQLVTSSYCLEEWCKKTVCLTHLAPKEYFTLGFIAHDIQNEPFVIVTVDHKGAALKIIHIKWAYLYTINSLEALWLRLKRAERWHLIGIVYLHDCKRWQPQQSK